MEIEKFPLQDLYPPAAGEERDCGQRTKGAVDPASDLIDFR